MVVHKSNFYTSRCCNDWIKVKSHWIQFICQFSFPLSTFTHLWIYADFWYTPCHADYYVYFPFNLYWFSEPQNRKLWRLLCFHFVQHISSNCIDVVNVDLLYVKYLKLANLVILTKTNAMQRNLTLKFHRSKSIRNAMIQSV